MKKYVKPYLEIENLELEEIMLMSNFDEEMEDEPNSNDSE